MDNLSGVSVQISSIDQDGKVNGYAWTEIGWMETEDVIKRNINGVMTIVRNQYGGNVVIDSPTKRFNTADELIRYYQPKGPNPVYTLKEDEW